MASIGMVTNRAGDRPDGVALCKAVGVKEDATAKYSAERGHPKAHATAKVASLRGGQPWGAHALLACGRSAGWGATTQQAVRVTRPRTRPKAQSNNDHVHMCAHEHMNNARIRCSTRPLHSCHEDLTAPTQEHKHFDAQMC